MIDRIQTAQLARIAREANSALSLTLRDYAELESRLTGLPKAKIVNAICGEMIRIGYVYAACNRGEGTREILRNSKALVELAIDATQRPKGGVA